MVMSKKFCRSIIMFVAMSLYAMGSLYAQVLPVLNSFRGRTFQGTVDVSWPVLFEDCSFVTDSVVLRHSYGAVFRNCRFESMTGTLYMAESGAGIIMADCEVIGCNELKFCRKQTLSDRNYVTGIKVNGDECSVLDDQESIVEIDGLELEENVRHNMSEPVFMLISADRNNLKANETAVLRVRGLHTGMFIGWQSSDPSIELNVEDEFTCVVNAPAQIPAAGTVIISAYTEYGLEAVCELRLVPDEPNVTTEKKSRRRK